MNNDISTGTENGRHLPLIPDWRDVSRSFAALYSICPTVELDGKLNPYGSWQLLSANVVETLRSELSFPGHAGAAPALLIASPQKKHLVWVCAMQDLPPKEEIDDLSSALKHRLGLNVKVHALALQLESSHTMGYLLNNFASPITLLKGLSVHPAQFASAYFQLPATEEEIKNPIVAAKTVRKSRHPSQRLAKKKAPRSTKVEK